MSFTMPSWKQVVKTVHQCYHLVTTSSGNPESRDTSTPNLTMNLSTIVSRIYLTNSNGLKRLFYLQKSQELKTVSYHKFYDILKQHQNEVNEIRAKRLARTTNPLVLVTQQQPVYHPQNHPNHYTQNSSTRSYKLLPETELNVEQADWRDDPDDEPEDQELEAHYMYMRTSEQPESVNDTYLEEQGYTNITIDSLDMSANGEMLDQDDDDT
nr:hypothetical protein [Tanacetum cinerariifolium]